MNAAYIVIPVLVAWGVTALFIIPVTITLELMVCQLLRAKWKHLLSVMAGILLCIPMVLLTHPFSFASYIPVVGGMSLGWIALVVGLLNAALGTKIGYLLSKRISN